MSLFKIKDSLYKKKAPKNLSEHKESQYDPTSFQENQKNQQLSEEDLWEERNTSLDKEEKKIITKGAFLLGVIVLLVLGTVIFYGVRKIIFKPSGASVDIIGSKQALSGQLLTYEINYKNNNRVNLKKAIIKITYPESFKPESNDNFQEDSPTSGTFSLGTVKSKSQGKVILNGKNFSPKGALIYIRVSLLYSPAGFTGQFETKSQLGVNITSTPINLSVQAPQNITSGDQINYLINYRNDGDVALDNLIVKLNYPEGFTFAKAKPSAMEGNNIWYLGSLAKNQSGKILVSGKLEGERDQVKKVKVHIGSMQKDKFISYNDEGVDTKIVSSPLEISQTIDNQKNLNVKAGDFLNFAINYKNTGTIGLRNIIITEKIDSPVLDYTSLKMNGGHFDAGNKTITWKASDISQLRNLGQNQGGTIKFSVQVKNVLPVKGENDKNFVISSIAKIDSPDIITPISMNKIISSNVMNTKVNSKLILETGGYYDDYKISNSGPNPPQVNQETTYTLHWKVTNVSNDIIGAKVEAVLPTDVVATGKIFPEDARVVYNSRNNSIIWTIGNVKSGTGILTKPLEVYFQVKIKPAPNQIKREINLLGSSILTAQDVFTQDKLQVTAKALGTKSIGDIAGDGLVIP